MIDWPRTMPALVTAFSDDGTLDLDAHRRNVATIVARGARGALIGGSTGEGPYLEPGERSDLVAAARDVAPDATVVVGVNAESVRQARAQIAEGADAGADAALVITPTTLVRSDAEAVERFYLACAHAATIPILLYSVPSVTGWELPAASVVRLAEEESIIGIKDSGGDSSRVERLRDVIARGFVVYAGASSALLASHHAGAWGAITASANYALPEVSLASRGEAAAQHRLTALAATVERHGVPGTKWAARLSGLEPGPPRSPLAELGEPATAEIASALARAGLASTEARGDR